MTVTQQTLVLARSPGQSVVVCTTPAGSPSEAAMARLRQASAVERSGRSGGPALPDRSTVAR